MQRYTPDTTVVDRSDVSTQELARYVKKEFEAIAAGLGIISDGYMEELGAAPGKPREGQLVYADGVGWVPGGSKGLVVYDGALWQNVLTLPGFSGSAFHFIRVNNAGTGIISATATEDASNNVFIAGGVNAGGGAQIGTKRSTFTANSEVFCVGFRYVSTGSPVYFGATDGSATPGFIISNNGGTTIMSSTYAGVVSIRNSLGINSLRVPGNTSGGDSGAILELYTTGAAGAAGNGALRWFGDNGLYVGWIAKADAVIDTNAFAGARLTFTTPAVITGNPLVTLTMKAGMVGVGVTPVVALDVNGVVGLQDGGTKNRNGGLVSESSAAIVNFGVNEDSGNRFGGSYTSGDQGGMLRVDTRSGNPLFTFFGRAATSTAAVTALLKLFSDGRLAGTALHNNAGAVTGTTDQFIASGGYLPTLTGIVNVSSSTSQTCFWLRVGNVVLVAGQILVTPTANATGTAIGISLPIASNLTNAQDLGGVGVHNTGTPVVGSIVADSTNDRAQAAWISNATASQAFTFIFAYLVQ